ncbi:MAG: hypothetical protein ACYDAY_07735 [Candidatus Dormibacteria bacterium]
MSRIPHLRLAGLCAAALTSLAAVPALAAPTNATYVGSYAHFTDPDGVSRNFYAEMDVTTSNFFYYAHYWTWPAGSLSCGNVDDTGTATFAPLGGGGSLIHVTADTRWGALDAYWYDQSLTPGPPSASALVCPLPPAADAGVAEGLPATTRFHFPSGEADGTGVIGLASVTTSH